MTKRYDEIYWQRRHEEFRGQLRAVGNLKWAEGQIAQQFAKDEAVIREALSSLNLAPGAVVLDVGCGIGRLAPCVLGLGLDYDGIDISPVAIEEARRLQDPRAYFEVHDIATRPVAYSCDVAVCLFLFQHVIDEDDWERALENVIGPLREPGGYLIILDSIPRLHPPQRTAAHVLLRPLSMYEELLGSAGMRFVKVPASSRGLYVASSRPR